MFHSFRRFDETLCPRNIPVLDESLGFYLHVTIKMTNVVAIRDFFYFPVLMVHGLFEFIKSSSKTASIKILRTSIIVTNPTHCQRKKSLKLLAITTTLLIHVQKKVQ